MTNECVLVFNVKCFNSYFYLVNVGKNRGGKMKKGIILNKEREMKKYP